jgi:hypothetical protein
MLRLRMADTLRVSVVVQSTYGFVADVAEQLFTIVTNDCVVLSLLLIDRLAMWALCAELDIDVIGICADALLFHLSCDLFWLKCTREFFARRLLFEMFLTFGNTSATPAELSIATIALNMGTL